jgi:aminoglycoside 2'-N-acetyltransferase I
VTDVQLRTVRTAELSRVELDQLRALLEAAFADRFGDDAWSHALGGQHVLATAGGDLVGHGSVVVRELTAGATTLRTGYVEAVATAAAWRRQGIGSAVMAEVERLVRGTYEFGALSSSRQAVGLYDARGWLRWRGPTAARTPAGIVDSPGEAVFVLPTPTTPPGLDPTVRLICDFRPGELW